METKEQLVAQIKGWMANDNELLELQRRVKELKENRKTLNKTTLVNALVKYFKDDDEQAKELSKFLLDSREEKVKETIRRKINKD